MEITFSYIASFISTILGLCEPFGKKMKTILTFNFLGNLLVGISYYLISGISGAAVCFIACVQVVINYMFDKRGKRVPLIVVILHALIFLTVNLMTFGHWYDAFALVASLLFVFSIAQSTSRCYRVLYVLNSFMWIFYDICAQAYGNLCTHIILFLATMLAIFVRDVKGRNT